MSLNRQDVVRAAVDVLDHYGLEDLTMRRLAGLLGVKAGALYWHVTNKQTLLALVSDEILREPDGAERIDTGVDVRDHHHGDPLGASSGSRDELADAVRRWAGLVRAALLRHRDGAEVVASTMPVGLGTVDPAAEVSTLLERYGFSGHQRRYSSRALVHFILGHVIEEQTRSQLHELGVVDQFDRRAEEEDFADGLELLVTGLRGVTTGGAEDSSQVENADI